MSAPPLIDERMGSCEIRSPRTWLSGWRLGIPLAAAAAATSGLVLAWDWLADGGVFVLFVIVVPCILAYALARLFTGAAGNKSAREMDGT